MTETKVQKLKPGLYKIFWNEGGYSFASVGNTPDGKAWLAPTNWINVCSEFTSGQKTWRMVKKVELIVGNNQHLERA